MNEKVDQSPAQVALLTGFVEGWVSGEELDQALATNEMSLLLSIFEDPRYPASSNHFRKLQKQDRVSLGGLVNSEGIIEDFLQKAGVQFQPAKRFGNLYSLLLKALPSYLDPPVEFLLRLLPDDEPLSEREKARILKQRLKEEFRMISQPPRWIQDPDWPIHEGKPLIFIDQLNLDAPELFHDTGALYVFYNPATGSFETVAQFA